MQYILKNLRLLFKNEPFLVIVIIICVFTSSWIMTFSYGLYQNYNVQKTEAEIQTNRASPTIADGETLTKGELVRYFTSLSDELCDAADIFYAMNIYKGFYNDDSESDFVFNFRFDVKNGKLCSSEYIENMWIENGLLYSGRWFLDEEESEGIGAALIPYEIGISEMSLRSDYVEMISEDEIKLFGNSYKIIGVYKANGSTPIVPLNSLPDDFKIDGISIQFKEAITKKQYEELKSQSALELSGKLVFPDMPFPDRESMYLYNNIMMIAVLIAILAAVNFASLYFFILQKRKKQIAVFSICGAEKRKIFAIYLGECCLISFPVFALGTAVYIPVMHLFLAKAFPYMEESYSPVIYLALFGIYAAIMLVVITIILVKVLRKNPVEIRREGTV